MIFPNDDPTSEAVNALQEEVDKTAAINSSNVPLNTLIPFIEGHSWTVEYYAQVLGDTDEPQSQSLTLDPILQQYHLILGFEFRVSSPLDYTYSAETTSDTLVGTATIYPGTVVPTKYDMFLADIGDGHYGVFTLVNVTPLMVGMDRCYSVEYHMVVYQDQARVDDLTSKVIQTSTFDKDFLVAGQNPILTSESVTVKNDLEEYGKSLFALYKSQFISRNIKYVLVPGQEEIAYDHFLAKALDSFIDISTHKELTVLNWPSFNGSSEMSIDTVWDNLLDLTPVAEKHICKQMQLVDTWHFKSAPSFTNVFYTPLKRIIYPAEDIMDVDDDYTLPIAPTNYVIQPGSVGVIETLDAGTDPAIIYPTNDIYLVTTDDYYIFSQAFYDDDREAQSLLELVVTRMLADEAISPSDIRLLCGNAPKWGSLERFYYIPIVMMVIQYVIRRL